MKKKTLLIIFVFIQFIVFSQQEDAWVYFTDKENVAEALVNPISILTQKALDRKTRHNVIIDERDVPVSENYISQVKNASGIVVMSKSKWLNTVHVRGTEADINNLLNLSIIDHIEFANRNLNVSTSIETDLINFNVENPQPAFNYGTTEIQVSMISADILHQMNYTGEGVTVAVLDAGFPNVNTMGAFQRLRDAGNLKGGYDFVDKTSDVYASKSTTHGTRVLSNMAGFIEDEFVGTAPDADYYLFRTENVNNENPVEMSYWVEAIERADSLGVDIVSTSLGYLGFDNIVNYDRSDFDGNTIYISRGATIASDKGLLVVAATGNSAEIGVTAPADSEGVLSVGAVDGNGNYADFSSQGDNVQTIIKPDVVARGDGSYAIQADNTIIVDRGTSYSAPTLAGGIACLIQALPNQTNTELMQLIRESGSQFNNPDNFLGFGIPDLSQIISSTLSVEEVSQEKFTIFPNPVSNRLQIVFPKNIQEAQVSLFDILGKLILNKGISETSNSINLEDTKTGIYIIKIQSQNQTNTYKLIKQ